MSVSSPALKGISVSVVLREPRSGSNRRPPVSFVRAGSTALGSRFARSSHVCQAASGQDNGGTIEQWWAAAAETRARVTVCATMIVAPRVSERRNRGIACASSSVTCRRWNSASLARAWGSAAAMVEPSFSDEFAMTLDCDTQGRSGDSPLRDAFACGFLHPNTFRLRAPTSGAFV